jgi:hypothetical protein
LKSREKRENMEKINLLLTPAEATALFAALKTITNTQLVDAGMDRKARVEYWGGFLEVGVAAGRVAKCLGNIKEV